MATILLIDDNAQLRRLLVRALTDAGHAVVEAKDGGDGLRQFARHQPALVVTDIVMPDHEGLETIRALRRLAPLLPVIAISGSGEMNGAALYLDFARKFGASSMLHKPFRPSELIAEIDRLLPAETAEPLIAGDQS